MDAVHLSQLILLLVMVVQIICVQDVLTYLKPELDHLLRRNYYNHHFRLHHHFSIKAGSSSTRNRTHSGQFDGNGEASVTSQTNSTKSGSHKQHVKRHSTDPPAVSTTVFSNTLAGPGLAAMFTPPPSFQNNDRTPTFVDTTPTNVTVIRGRLAELKCAVQNLGTKSVSWVRHEDIHVLTVGRITFTNDGRFVAHNTPGSNVWSLRIKFPQLRDSGLYECQVSVRPPLARVVQLNVVEPQAVIPPGRELFVDRGSPLNITCVVPDSPEPPRNVFWYHHNKMVTFDSTRPGVTVSTSKGAVTVSILRIPDVHLKDSGKYICSPEGMKEASVTVTVLHGELPQAMQTGSTCRACFGSHILLLVIISYLVGLPYLFLPAVEALSTIPIQGTRVIDENKNNSANLYSTNTLCFNISHCKNIALDANGISFCTDVGCCCSKKFRHRLHDESLLSVFLDDVAIR